MRAPRSLAVGLLISLLLTSGINAQQSAYTLGALARSSALMGKVDEAIDYYDKQLALGPDMIAYNARAALKLKKRDLAGALADYDKSIALIKPGDNDHDIIYGNRAAARFQSGNADGAIADLDRAIALKPDKPGHYNNRGYIKESKADLDGAIADYSKAVALDPDEVNFHENRASARVDKGDLAGAIADYDELVEIEPEDAGYINYRGFLYLLKEDPDRAIRDFDAALTIQPSRTVSFWFRGFARQAKGDLEGAIIDHNRVIVLAKDDAERTWAFREVLLRRLQRSTPFADLAKTVAKWKESFSKDVGLYLVEALSEEDLLAKAAKAKPEDVAALQCVAFYFVGMTKLIANDQVAARRLFEQCVATKQFDVGEFILARAELVRMGAKP